MIRKLRHLNKEIPGRIFLDIFRFFCLVFCLSSADALILSNLKSFSASSVLIERTWVYFLSFCAYSQLRHAIKEIIKRINENPSHLYFISLSLLKNYARHKITKIPEFVKFKLAFYLQLWSQTRALYWSGVRGMP